MSILQKLRDLAVQNMYSKYVMPGEIPVLIKKLNDAEVQSWRAGVANKNLKVDIKAIINRRARLLAISVYDEYYVLVGNSEDWGKIDSSMVEELYKEVLKFNGMKEYKTEFENNNDEAAQEGN